MRGEGITGVTYNPISLTVLRDSRLQRCSTAAAAAAAKLLQSCLTLCNPIDVSPPGCPVPGILQARILDWVAISFSDAWKWKMKVKSFSHILLLATPWTAAHQAPPSMGFSRREYWSGVPSLDCLKWEEVGGITLLSHHSWHTEQKRGTYLELSWEIADFKSNRITDYSGPSFIFLVFLYSHHLGSVPCLRKLPFFHSSS